MTEKILIATHNSAKFERYKALLEPLKNLEIVSLSDVGITEKINEPFINTKDNAIHKAKFYSKLSNLITIAIDEAVQTNFLPNNEQPGVYVRRLKKGKTEATDKEVLDFWEELFKHYPQTDKKFIWDYGIAYYNNKTNQLGYSQIEIESTIKQPFSKKLTPGYPMSSFLILPGTDKCHGDLTEQEKTANDIIYFENFIKNFSSWIKESSVT